MAETKKMIDDLIKVQGSLPSFKKDSKGAFGEYITLDQINDKALPLLAKNNFAWITMPGYDESGNAVLNYSLIHTSGEKIDGSMHLMIDKQNSQGLGSAITYARRYAINAVLGITADVDDDAGRASEKDTVIKKAGGSASGSASPSSDRSNEPMSEQQPAHKASEKQVKLIKDMLKTKLEVKTLGDVKRVIQLVADADTVEDLNVSQASDVIKLLTETTKDKINERLITAEEPF